MPKYNAMVGCYVRSYCQFDFEADNDEAAKAAAIAKFKADENDISFDETDWDNKALPSIVQIERDHETAILDTVTILEHENFALTEDDARDIHAAEMLKTLQAIATDPQMTLHKIVGAARAVVAKIEADTPPKPKPTTAEQLKERGIIT